MSNTFNDLGWGERLAVVKHFGLNDKQATTALGVTQDELTTARDLAQAGTIAIAEGVDFSQFEDELSTKKTTKPEATATATTKPTSTAETPVTATKPVREPKKRGRKGDKIKNAFLAIPTTATGAEEFITTHGISMNVLRQGKRFDTSGLDGTVHVRKSKDTGILMVWRDDPTAD